MAWDIAADLKKVGDAISGGLESLNPFIDVANLISAWQSGEAAADAASMSEAQIAAAMRAAEQVRAYYKEGGEAMSSNMQALLETFGNFGQVTPDNLNTFVKKVAEWRTTEDEGDEEEYDTDLTDLKGQISTLTGIDQENLTNTEGAFRSLADYVLGESDDLYTTRDADAKANAPSSLDYAQQFDGLASKFTNLRMQNAKRAIDTAYGDALASLPAGFENSTMRVAMATSLADYSAQQQNQAILDGITDAQNYLGGLQTVASNEQNITNAERNLVSGLTTSGASYASTGVNNMINSGNYGIGYANTYSDLDGTNLNYASALNNSPFTFRKNMESMNTGTALSDYTAGSTLMNNNAASASNYIDTVTGYITNPYSYAATGANNASGTMNNAAINSAELSKIYGANAGDGFTSFGYNSEDD